MAEYEHTYFDELAVVPLPSRYTDPVTTLLFDQQHEALWAGTEDGMLHTLLCPSLSRFASWRAHPSAVLDMAPLPGMVLSISERRLALNAPGGAPRLSLSLPSDAADGWRCCALDSNQPAYVAAFSSRALLGCQSGTLMVHDLASNKALGKHKVWDSSVELLAGGEAGMRGLVAVGGANGRIALVDPRRGYKAEATVGCHPGGLACMVVKGDTLATCGMSVRMGVPVTDSTVKVFDIRSTPRPLLSLPSVSPALLAWHPTWSAQLLIVSAGGLFSLMDVGSLGTLATYQVDTGGDSLAAGAFAPSGQAIAFGGSGGFVHLWANSDDPSVASPAYAGSATPLALPPKAQPRPQVRLMEGDPFGGVPQYYCSNSLLSDFGETELMEVGLPPHLIDVALMQGMKQVDFVGYIPNPAYSRNKPRGHAARDSAALRNRRVVVAQETAADAESQRLDRAEERAAAGGIVLPARYKRTEIKAQTTGRFEEFDFSFYNRTNFAGLENDVPNSYCNPLLQALYFIPAFRNAILDHAPEADAEFCLSCEMMFLFGMMARARGTPCRASNLLRALRQVREAGALGLLDGVGQRTAGDARGWEAEMGNTSALPLRLVALGRFLLDRLAKDARGEDGDRATPTSSTPEGGGGDGGNEAVPAPRGGPAASPAPARRGDSVAAPSPPPPRPPAGDAVLAGVIDSLFSLRYRQSMVALSGPGKGTASRSRQSTTFQVELAYPSGSTRGKAATASPAITPLPTPLASPIKQLASPAASPSTGRTPTPEGVRSSPSPLVLGASAAASPVPGGVGSAAAAPAARPTFGQLLGSSLRAVTETRAWFDDTVGYQWVRQARVPLSLPKVLHVSCALSDASQVSYWQPAVEAVLQPDGTWQSSERSWLPHALRIDSWPDEDRVAVVEGGTPQQLAVPAGDAHAPAAPVSKVYELTAVMCHVVDYDDMADPPRPPSTPLLPASPAPTPLPPDASATRPGSALDASLMPGATAGAAATPSPQPPPSPSPVAAAEGEVAGLGSGFGVLFGSCAPRGHLVALIRVPGAYLEEVGGPLRQSSLSASPGGGGGFAASAGAAPSAGLARGGGGAGGASAQVPRSASTRLLSFTTGEGGHTFSLPETLDDVFSGPGSAAEADASGDGAAADAPGPAASADAAAAGAAHGPDAAGGGDGDGGAGSSRGSPRAAGGTAAAAEAGARAAAAVDQWFVFNDFVITPVAASEVDNLYGGQKMPCLLMYTQVTSEDEGPALEPPTRSLRMSDQQLHDLCRAPPLQGPAYSPPGGWPFTPLDVLGGEVPAPDMLVAIDAEFVALSPPETSFEGGSEVTLRPSRLGLARVSVLRGGGPRAGVPCIDDYVRATEPVYDYLTRFSGILPGDLHPSSSSRHLVTLKCAYLKLAALVAAGCCFVGHGLKQDFRMINLTVPADQVLDTVELWSFRRHRKLSLRFLSSYVLGLSIQGATHDSVEDARSALALYREYTRLQAQGTFNDKLSEIYRWGKKHGWEPVVWDAKGLPQPASAAGATVAPASAAAAVARGG